MACFPANSVPKIAMNQATITQIGYAVEGTPESFVVDNTKLLYAVMYRQDRQMYVGGQIIIPSLCRTHPFIIDFYGIADARIEYTDSTHVLLTADTTGYPIYLYYIEFNN